MMMVTVEVATLLTGLLPDEGAVTPAGKYLITCNCCFFIIIQIILKTRGRKVLDFPWWFLLCFHLSMCCSEVHHQLGVLVKGCTAEATFLGGKSSAELTEGRKTINTSSMPITLNLQEEVKF